MSTGGVNSPDHDLSRVYIQYNSGIYLNDLE